MIYLKDPKDGKPSVTLTAFVMGFGVATLKLLIAGITISGFTMAAFSGGDFAAVVGALGAVYYARRRTDSKPDSEPEA